MQSIKQSALQILLQLCVHAHQMSYRLIQWCENRLDEYEDLDEIIADIFGNERKPDRSGRPIHIIRVNRPRMH